jgi:YD repeat-containing protein
MISVNSTTFVYDSRGRIIKATSGDGTVTYYPSECYEVSTQGGTTTRTAYLIHQNRRASISSVIDSEKASQTSVLYYHHDHLGSTVAVSDGDGEIVTRYWYDDFGKVTRMEGRDSSRYKYSGKEAIEGLYYFGARFYDPTVCAVVLKIYK